MYSGSSLFRYFLNSEKGNNESASNTLSCILLSHYILGLSYWMSAQLWKACILWMNYFGLSLVRVLIRLQFRWSAKQTQYPPIPAYLGHILFSLIDHRTSLQTLETLVCQCLRKVNKPEILAANVFSSWHFISFLLFQYSFGLSRHST